MLGIQNTCFNKSWWMKNPVIYLLKVLGCVKNMKWHGIVVYSGLAHNQHRVNTLSLSCERQKLNQTNSILLFHLQKFWTWGRENSESIVLNRNERLPKDFLRWAVRKCVQLSSVLLQLPHQNSFGPGWRRCTLQARKWQVGSLQGLTLVSCCVESGVFATQRTKQKLCSRIKASLFVFK